MRAGLALAVMLAASVAAAAPARVASTNLCTDQLAMLLAAPGQLVSVSAVARDPVASAMAAEAARYPIHHGSAEEIFLLAPDLVVAGESDPPATLDMLRRLGIPVEIFPIETDLEDVRANMRRMGAALGREGQAEAMVAGLDAALAVPPPAGPRPRAAILYANAWTSGTGTLADAVLAAAGLGNVAAERGIVGMGPLPLEALAVAAPDLLVLGQDYGTPALAQEILAHPVVAALGADRAAVDDSLWVCGTPLLARAVEALRSRTARP